MSSLEEAVQKQFGDVAEQYRLSAVHASGEDLAWMLSAVTLTGRERVLDAGCGAGHASAAFAPRVAKVTAYDLTPAMLAQVELLAAERKLTNIETRLGSVERLSLPDSSFDLVITRYSAHHWARPMAALREFRRVLSPGGTLILSDIVAPDAPLLDTWLQTWELLRDMSHVRDHSTAEWIAMVETAGFSAEVREQWMLPLEFAGWLARIRTAPVYASAIAQLMAEAPKEVQAYFQITFASDGSRTVPHTFSIPGAIIVGKT